MGRPRKFSLDAAVAAALPLFIERGYEGAAFGELTAAMGISPPSFYAAFGSKEGLFRAATELYVRQSEQGTVDALSQPTALQVVEALLSGAADMQTDPSHAGGCLLVQGALACSAKAAGTRETLTSMRTAIEPMLQVRLEDALAQGDTSVRGAPRDVARFISTVIQGMAVQAAGGKSRADLHNIADVTLTGIMCGQ